MPRVPTLNDYVDLRIQDTAIVHDHLLNQIKLSLSQNGLPSECLIRFLLLPPVLSSVLLGSLNLLLLCKPIAYLTNLSISTSFIPQQW